MHPNGLSRRALARTGLGFVAGTTFGALAPVAAQASGAADAGADPSNSQVIETHLGRLIGEVSGTGAGRVLALKGIPYALPPVGDRRWKPAAPAPAWNCTRDARVFGPQAVQGTEPDQMFFALPQPVQGEDCLYLNIWTPAADARPATHAPVMVWIHGGAFINGAGSVPAYDGAALARKGVVVVTVNYRLGVFGYFAHPDLIAEADGGICANFGTTDQIEALRWVQKNIAAFGGDPGNVTIFGESAGSMSVCQLMASPLTKGLFHRAIGESGGFFYPMREIGRAAWGGPPAEALGATFARRAGAPTLSELRRMTADDLLRAVAQHGDVLNGLGALIVVDGVVFPRQVHETFRRGDQHAVPVLLGFNSDEASGIADYGGVPSITDPVAYEALVRARLGGLADDFLKLYPASHPQRSACNAYRDDAFGWHMIEWAELMAGVSREAYLYHFTHAPPGADAERQVAQGPGRLRIGAYHASEIIYAFNNMDHDILSVWGDGEPHANRPYGGKRVEDVRLADAMSDYWVAFAKTGAPAALGRPLWRPYTSTARHFMTFAAEPQPSTDLMPGMWSLNSKIKRARLNADAFWYFGSEGLAGPPLPLGV